MEADGTASDHLESFAMSELGSASLPDWYPPLAESSMINEWLYDHLPIELVIRGIVNGVSLIYHEDYITAGIMILSVLVFIGALILNLLRLIYPLIRLKRPPLMPILIILALTGWTQLVWVASAGNTFSVTLMSDACSNPTPQPEYH